MVIAICFTLGKVFRIVLSVGLASLCVLVRSSDADLVEVSSVFQFTCGESRQIIINEINVNKSELCFGNVYRFHLTKLFKTIV